VAKKAKTQYVCRECGADSNKWLGQCSDCSAWNSYDELAVATASKTAVPVGYAGVERGVSSVKRLTEVSAVQVGRTNTGIGELDRVLGGGLVAGSVILVGGEPGIGKSTLLLQTMAALVERELCLYVTGEESLQQIAERAGRMGLDSPDLLLMAETHVEQLIAAAKIHKPRVMVVDSIQTMFSDSIGAAPGAVSQVREAAAQLVRFAKQSGTTVMLVGHVTKEGTIAGPRVLEHMVDTVLYFESEAGSRFRMIRSVKNRFGAANEIGVFAMVDSGLKEVKNPSAIFLSKHEAPVAGSVIMVTREGTRPLLAEVQALVDESGGYGKRVSIGLEQNRLGVLFAALHRHAGVSLAGQDVFVNVVGGIRVSEPAADLAVVLASLSSLRDQPFPADTVVFGELGLAGEVRPVPHGEERLREAAKHGFKRAIVPMANKPRDDIGIKVIGVSRLQQAIDAYRNND
jgi:DNA repair protein RadA/Sms